MAEDASRAAAPKRPIRLPEVLSREEVERLIMCAASPLHRIWLLTLCATGMRRNEPTHLKVADIDSAIEPFPQSPLAVMPPIRS